MKTESSKIKQVPERGKTVHKKKGLTVKRNLKPKNPDPELQEADLDWRSIFDNAQEGIYQSSLEGRYLRVNQAMARIYGYDSPLKMIEQVKDIRTQIYVRTQDRDEFKRLMDKYGRVENFEASNYRQDGSIIWIRTNARLVKDKKSSPYFEGLLVDITEHRLAEEALKESEEKYRLHFGAVSDVVFSYNKEFRILSVSPSVKKLLGYSPEELIGKTLAELNIMPPASQRTAIANANRIFIGKSILSTEYEFITKAGKRIIGDVSGAPLVENGKIIGVIAVGRDITERKNAEAALRESEERYRGLVELSPDGVAVHNGNNLLFINAFGAKILGIEDPNKAAGMPMIDFVHPDSRPIVSARVKQMQQIGQAQPLIEEKFLRMNGSTVDVEVAAMPVVWGGKPAIQVAFRDIAERKRMEEALKQERNLLRTLIDATPDKIFVKDIQGHKIVANLADWQSSGGKTMEDILGKTDFDTYPADLAAKYWADDKMVMDTGTPIKNNEEPSRDAQGNPVWTLTTKVPFKDGQGHIIGLVGIARDITEHRLAEEALKESEEKYRLLVEEIPAITYIDRADGSGLTSFVSPQIETVLGISQEKWMQSDDSFWLNMIHPDDRERVASAHQHTLSTGEPFNEEYRMITQEGRIVWIKDHSILLKDTTGKPISLHGVMFDITESKQAEVALLDSQQMLQTVLDTIPVRVFWKDRKSHFLGGNLPFALDAGLLSPHDLLGKDDYEMNWREQADAYRSDDRLVMETGIPKIGYEEPQTTPNGSHIWLRTSKVPLLDSDGKTIGVLGTYEDITPQKLAEQRILQLNRLYAMLSQINQVIVRVPDQETLFHEICNAAIEQGGYRMAWIGMCDETRQAVKPAAFAGFEQRYLTKIDISYNPDQENGRGPSGTAIRENRCVTCQDIATDPRMVLWRENGLQRGYRSVASVPFQQQGKVCGILSVYSGEVNAFTTDDEELLMEISRDISFALNRMTAETARKRAEERIHQQVERLTALTAIDQAISSSFDLHISLSILLFHAAKQLKVDALSVLLLNPNLNMLEYYTGRGFRNPDIEKATVGLRDDGAGRVALNRQLVTVTDLSISFSEFSRGKLLEAESFVTYYGVPLIAKGKIKGVLETFHRSPLTPDREWLDFLNTLAGQAAIAVDNSQLFDGLQRSNAELRMAYDSTIEGWSHALDLRDKETEGHTQRVLEMTMQLADAAGMTEEEMVHVRRGALLHDIGKMGIPDSILLKSGELTNEEKEIMHRHPSLAYEMLSRIGYLRPALDIPYCHHEKWDGTGYPRGLKGEQIPLAARLFAIVDVWDALRSDRTYRKSWPKEKVFEYIRSLSGTNFDPSVVEMFFDEFSEQS